MYIYMYIYITAPFFNATTPIFYRPSQEIAPKQ